MVKFQSLLISTILAFLVGVAQYVLVALAWAYIGAYSPLPGLLAQHVDSVAALQAFLLPVDCLINFVLALPAAYVLITLRPSKLWLYLLFAVVPAFLWSNRLLVGNPYVAMFAWQFIAGLLVQLLALPVAAWFLLAITGRGTPNNSIQRTRYARR